MKEQLLTYKDKALNTWNEMGKTQRWMTIGIILFLIISLIFLVFWASQPEFTTIYSNLSPTETGEIVSEIEAKGVPVEISPDGRSVSVPKAEASRLKVELAHTGIPRSGNINYGVFSENMGLGMTDRHFDVVHKDAMQNELRYLIEQIEGIDQAKVMITLPRETVWVADENEAATASVVLTTRSNLELHPDQIRGLYHVISKSVPNLPIENIVIMDHNWRTFDLEEGSEYDTTLTAHQQQRQIRKDIENDIQRELQQLLGTILGMDKVVVSVFASVDFSKESREEHLVQPVDDLTNEGIAISIERIQESFVGEGGTAGGVPGTGDGDIAGYQGVEEGQDSEYEKLEERINREVDRIYRQVESSPYLIEDLTIHVGVEPPDPEDPESLTVQNIEDIRSILSSVVQTYLSTSPTNIMDPQVIDGKISVFAHEFRGKPVFESTETTTFSNPIIYALAAVGVLLIAGILFAMIRRNRNVVQETEEETSPPTVEDYDFEQENEETAKRKRLEKLAKDKPDEFVKLMRTWLSED